MSKYIVLIRYIVISFKHVCLLMTKQSDFIIFVFCLFGWSKCIPERNYGIMKNKEKWHTDLCKRLNVMNILTLHTNMGRYMSHRKCVHSHNCVLRIQFSLFSLYMRKVQRETRTWKPNFVPKVIDLSVQIYWLYHTRG